MKAAQSLHMYLLSDYARNISKSGQRMSIINRTLVKDDRSHKMYLVHIVMHCGTAIRCQCVKFMIFIGLYSHIGPLNILHTIIITFNQKCVFIELHSLSLLLAWFPSSLQYHIYEKLLGMRLNNTLAYASYN